MKRVKEKESGVVHFLGVNEHTLCGRSAGVDLLGEVRKMDMLAKETSDPVTCPDCAKLYCRVKNAPWNEVEDAAMDQAMYDAVKPDGCSDGGCEDD